MRHDLTVRALLVVAAALPACLPDDGWKRRGTTEPEEIEDGWTIDTPESVGLDPDELARIHDELLREDRHFGTLGFLVVKDGKLVFETYLRDAADRERLHHIQSMTKSVTSLAVGAALDQGLIESLDQRLTDYLPEAVFEGLDARKREITIEHLLTMRSGLEVYNDTFYVETLIDRPRDPLRFMLKKHLLADPGERYSYRDIDPAVLAYVLEAATGRSEEAFVREALFEPLGIEDYLWETMPDGTTIGGTGLYLRPRDSARLGQAMLECFEGDGGIVSHAYCAEAMRLHVPVEDTLGKREDIPRAFGYYYWILPDDDAFAAWGHGGQYLLIVPDQQLVLIQVALPDTDYLHGGWLEDFVELTRPLVRELRSR